MAAGYLTAQTHPWLFRPLQSDGGAGVRQAFALGAQIKQRSIDNDLRAREMELKWRAMDLEAQLNYTKLAAHEQIAQGHTELGQVLSEIGASGDWSNPTNKAKFWGTAAKYPMLMKDPSFKELTQTFELADQAKLREQLLQLQVEGRVDLEGIRQKNRLEALTTRLDRMSEMKMDDQAFKVEMEGLLQEHRLERDKAKASTSGADRFDLNKSDEIAFRAELASLKSAFDQGVLEPDEFEKKREAVIAKYKARARTEPGAPAGPATNAAPKVLKFDPATGTIK